MATIIIAGLAAAGSSALAGFTIGSLGVAASAAVVGVAAAGAAYYASTVMDDMFSNQPGGAGVVQLGDQATPIDKTAVQKQAETKIEIGEDENARKKRSKGKAAYKIALDKAATDAVPAPAVGVQAPTATDTGVQL